MSGMNSPLSEARPSSDASPVSVRFGAAGPSQSRRVPAVVYVGLRKVALAALGMAIIVGVWWLISLQTVAVRLPSPARVASAIATNFMDIPSLRFILFVSGGIVQNLAYTAGNVLFGVAVGTVSGLGVGILVGRSRIAR